MSALRNETRTRLAADADGTVAAFVRTPTDRCAHAHRYEEGARPEARGEGGA